MKFTTILGSLLISLVASAEDLPEPLSRVDRGWHRLRSAGVASWSARIRWTSSYLYECEDGSKVDLKGLELDFDWSSETALPKAAIRGRMDSLPESEADTVEALTANQILYLLMEPLDGLKGMRSSGATLEASDDGRTVVAKVPSGPSLTCTISDDGSQLRLDHRAGEGVPMRTVTYGLRWQEDRCLVDSEAQPAVEGLCNGIERQIEWQTVDGVALPSRIRSVETRTDGESLTVELDLQDASVVRR